MIASRARPRPNPAAHRGVEGARRHRRAGGGQPTGRARDIEQIWIFTPADGVITEIRAVSDRLGMFIQLGWDRPAED
ncbi:ester cyclase [Nocardia sp. alder85J]|uniref:ester cyclase n=1 Tax=Nocardia sp. alder85J TaxID=2862949 RepID=UPI001CD5EC19|nr:ester cyclase [Nocardia sp. alder85J]MCX4091820.1 ester cyclase [Nocardia sp. alder85J]